MTSIKMPIQSFSDIITNSSSELFCVIQGFPLVMQEITDYLNSIGCSVDLQLEGYQDGLDTTKEELAAIFLIGEYDQDVKSMTNLIALLKAVLSSDCFQDKPFEILDNASY